MKRSRTGWVLLAAVGFCLLPAFADEPVGKGKGDGQDKGSVQGKGEGQGGRGKGNEGGVAKGRGENPLKAVIENKTSEAKGDAKGNGQDRGKIIFEPAIKDAIKNKTAAPLPPVHQPRPDNAKGGGQNPLKNLIKQGTGVANPFPPRRDVGKSDVVEPPAKAIVKDGTAPVDPKVGANDNPKVAPGKVNWHKDFAAACAASKKSGKPVLLFQMMGKLDDLFC